MMRAREAGAAPRGAQRPGAQRAPARGQVDPVGVEDVEWNDGFDRGNGAAAQGRAAWAAPDAPGHNASALAPRVAASSFVRQSQDHRSAVCIPDPYAPAAQLAIVSARLSTAELHELANSGGLAGRMAGKRAALGSIAPSHDEALQISLDVINLVFGRDRASLLRVSDTPMQVEQTKTWKIKEAQLAKMRSTGAEIPADCNPLGFFYSMPVP
jgi:hypothetical protein